jgi:ATP adenylyltransferase
MEKNLWAPWRMEYILSKKTKECIFCLDKDESQDKKKLILFRSSLSFVIMNRYPYNNGHLMVAPFKHVPALEDLDGDTALNMFTLLKNSLGILRRCLRPEGFNVGINMGRVGGAGIEDHLHIHIVPRWNGDTNFMPVVGDVRVMPEHLDDTYNRLSPLFQALCNNTQTATP